MIYQQSRLLFWQYSSPYFPAFPTQLDVNWEKVACGRTKDQLDLTEQARIWLTNLSTVRPRSLKLWVTRPA